MRIVIAGCGRVGRDVALALSQYGDDVSLVDDRPEAFEELGKSFDGTFHEGRAYDVATLREAGLDDADVFLAVTDSDNSNLMAVQVAKAVFGVPKAIARLDDPKRERSYRALGVAFVAGARIVSQVLVEQIRDPDFAYHLAFATNEVQIVEMDVGARAGGITVADFEIERALRIAAIQRDRRVFIPEPGDELVEGDLVVAAVQRGMSSKIREYLTRPPAEES
jgi:trk system potassium uptake protein TrkA